MSFWFGKKEKLRSEEYETLLNRIVALSGDVAELRQQIKLVSTDNNNLRGRFNRQLAGLPKEEEKVAPKEEEKPAEAKPLNTPSPKVFTGMSYEFARNT